MSTSHLYLVNQKYRLIGWTSDWSLELGSSRIALTLKRMGSDAISRCIVSKFSWIIGHRVTADRELLGRVKKQAHMGPCFLAHQAPLYPTVTDSGKKGYRTGPFSCVATHTGLCQQHKGQGSFSVYERCNSGSEAFNTLPIVTQLPADKTGHKPNSVAQQVCSLHWKKSDGPAHCLRNAYGAIQLRPSQ